MLGFAVGTALYNDKEVLVGMFAFISFYLIDVDSVAIMGLIVDSARIWVGSCFSIFGIGYCPLRIHSRAACNTLSLLYSETISFRTDGVAFFKT